MYIETSSPRQAGDKARLISPRYGPPDGPLCNLTFWYHMYGGSIGTLNVIAKPVTAGVPSNVIFTKSGNQGNQWRKASVNINASDSYNVSRLLSRFSNKVESVQFRHNKKHFERHLESLGNWPLRLEELIVAVIEKT